MVKKTIKFMLAILCWIAAILLLVEVIKNFKELDPWGLGFMFYIVPIGVMGILFLFVAFVLTKELIRKKK